VNILITEEQAQNPEFRKRGSQWHIGFLPSEKVPSYHCMKCSKDYDHSPKIEVHIYTMSDERANTLVAYKCSECSESIHIEYLESPDGIDKKYIVFDETGDWKKPTLKDIEEMLAKAEESAKRGEGNKLYGGSYESSLRRACHWADKISYEIPEERIKKIEKIYMNSYLRGMERELPELVKEIKDNAYGFSHHVSEVGISAFEGSGLFELLPRLYEALPFINLPEDAELKKDILRILSADMKMSEDSIARLEEEKKKTGEAIASERKELKEATRFMKKFRRRSGLKGKHVREAKGNPLGTGY
jgi:DNA-directed RNA polymerase subunit RPC12/RpoP